MRHLITLSFATGIGATVQEARIQDRGQQIGVTGLLLLCLVEHCAVLRLCVAFFAEAFRVCRSRPQMCIAISSANATTTNTVCRLRTRCTFSRRFGMLVSPGIRQLQYKLQRDLKLQNKDNARMMEENTALINEYAYFHCVSNMCAVGSCCHCCSARINELRREMRLLQIEHAAKEKDKVRRDTVHSGIAYS
jgi:hypothetical protein